MNQLLFFSFRSIKLQAHYHVIKSIQYLHICYLFIFRHILDEAEAILNDVALDQKKNLSVEHCYLEETRFLNSLIDT